MLRAAETGCVPKRLTVLVIHPTLTVHMQSETNITVMSTRLWCEKYAVRLINLQDSVKIKDTVKIQSLKNAVHFRYAA